MENYKNAVSNENGRQARRLNTELYLRSTTHNICSSSPTFAQKNLYTAETDNGRSRGVRSVQQFLN